MKIYNISNDREIISFKEALVKGVADDGGLYLPKTLPYFEDIKSLLKQDFISRSITIAKALFGDEFSEESIQRMVKNAFTFSPSLIELKSKIYAFELFSGPTLAFKDFGVRFMAQLLLEQQKDNPHQKNITILTATSGDTGAAVAHAFYNLPNVQVVILYPQNRISALQEKMIGTLGNNIHTLAVKGTFDDCQSLIKQSFADHALAKDLNLNTANSMNIGRLCAQIFYYFEALAQMKTLDEIVISVPCGNFGNLTAGLLAQQMGLPIKSFIVATNENDIVPHFLQTGEWVKKPTIATLSNAIDISAPNNWPRVVELFKNSHSNPQEKLRSHAVSESEMINAMRDLDHLNYIVDPHSAVAYAGLLACKRPKENGIFLCTAHPAKFKETVEKILQKDIPLPVELQEVLDKPILSTNINNDFSELKNYLMRM